MRGEERTTTTNTTFLDACMRKEPERTPVWFMRQAGRYLPSYRRIKGDRQVTEVAKIPEIASQVVVDAVTALGVDAGIIFADIMLPLEGMGIKFRIEENVGPVVANPVRSIDDVNALEALEPETHVGYIYDGIKATTEKLDGSVPLIGFSGAPFTLAGYMIEGAPSRDLQRTKAMMYSQPETWRSLMEKLTKMVKEYLGLQVKYGVQAVQLFDSWVGCLSPDDYGRHVLKYTKEVFSSIRRVPKIHFCADSSALVESFHKTGPDVLSVDWRLRIDDVWKRCGEETAVQGNLDPVVAMAGGGEMERRVLDILGRAQPHRGHIFSLGHGVLRDTDPENLRRIVAIVHSKTRRKK